MERVNWMDFLFASGSIPLFGWFYLAPSIVGAAETPFIFKLDWLTERPTLYPLRRQFLSLSFDPAESPFFLNFLLSSSTLCLLPDFGGRIGQDCAGHVDVVLSKSNVADAGRRCGRRSGWMLSSVKERNELRCHGQLLLTIYWVIENNFSRRTWIMSHGFLG